MTTTTQINITAKDSTAAAFASASGNLKQLSSSAVQAAASIAGVTLSFAGLASSIKSSINAADETFKLSQKIGVAVEQLAGLQLAFKQSGLGAEQLQNSVSRLSKSVATGNAAFASMGIATKDADGNLKSTRQILGEVSDKFAGYQDGIAKTALAIQIFGKAGADVIPLLNQGSESLRQFDSMAERLGLTLSTETARKAEEFNDTLSLVGQSFKGISTRIAAEMLPTLQGLAEQFFNTATQGGNVKVIADSISTALKGLVGVALGAAGAFKTVGTTLGGVAAMWGAIASGEFSQASTIVKQIKADFSENFKSTIDNVTNAWKANGSASVAALSATQKQVQIQAPLTSGIEKSTKAIEKQSKALNFQAGNLKELQEIYSKVQSITRGVETEQEKYNRTLEELNALKPYLGAETYARSLQKAQDELRGTASVTKTTVNEVDQLWTQAGRNIQSSLANSIFNFFDDGLKGMVKNVGIAVGRIASEFAALKIAQGIGLAGMFGVSGAAGASGGGSVLGGALSLGGNALSLAGGGFGSVGVAGSLLSMAPGQIGSFGIGMASGGGAGMSAAAGLGASFAAVAGPAMALFAADAIGRVLAGDRKLGGAEYIPVLGGFLAAMFGREPYKFRQQSLQGTVSSEGFDGNIANVFRSKGGLFSSNKHKTVIEELSRDQQLAFDTAIGVFYDSAHGFAENLGLPASLIDDYSTEIQIKSNKGGKLKESVITEMLNGIGDSLAKNVLPNIEELARSGERAFDTLSRLNTEFVGLAGGAVNLGASIEYAKELIKGMSFEARDSLISMAGGLENLGALTSYFNQNFLTEQERLLPVIETLNAGLTKLGIASDLSKEQFKSMVQDVSLSNETRISLLNLADELYTVRTAAEQSADALQKTADLIPEQSADALQKTADLIPEIGNVTTSMEATLTRMVTLSASLKSTITSISPAGSLDSSRAQVQDQIDFLNSKNRGSINKFDPDLTGALNTFQNQSTQGFTNRFDFARSQGKNTNLLNILSGMIDNLSKKLDDQIKYAKETSDTLNRVSNGGTSFATT